MIMDSNDRANLIRYRLGQANETIADVQLLIDNNRFRSAVNRIYYGMFYSLLALALANQFETSKHSQLISWFNKNFINEGLIDSKYGKIINKAFNKRTKGDYDTFVEFEKTLVVEMYVDMQDFIAEIAGYIKVD
jgi:uncharacterized protein (UPF0332 family)